MRRPRGADVVFGVLVAWSVIATGLTGMALWRRKLGAIQRPAADGKAVGVRGWAAYAAGPGVSISPSSRVPVLVVFSDFQCPFCREFSFVVDSLRARHPGLSIVDRHFPLVRLHAEAFDAALAAECAREVGRYTDMRHVLFARRELVAASEWDCWRTWPASGTPRHWTGVYRPSGMHPSSTRIQQPETGSEFRRRHHSC